MRVLVVILTLLAIGKITGYELLYRSAADDVIVSAYRPRAADACRRTEASRAYGLSEKAWTDAARAQLQIGKPGIRVYVWQTTHADWQTRYKNPYLHLTVGSPGQGMRCVYDIVTGTTQVSHI